MKTSLSRHLKALLFSACALGLMSHAYAEVEATAKKPSKGKVAKNKSTTKTTSVAEASPDIQGTQNIEYQCELGNSLVMYAKANDDQTMAMRWKNRLYKLTRVMTSTGAHRFENQQSGLVWIDIPAKGMLLDAHRGHQLANECKKTQIALNQNNSDAVQQ